MNGPPDHDERVLATDITRSVIVQAPAGSGKTTLLVERYLKLLCVVQQPEEILAITFTRKAASEMQGRVLNALMSASNSDSDHPSHAAQALRRSESLDWQLLDQPNRLKIQTIDSFAMSLTRGLPITSGFDPALKLTETADDYYRTAANRLLLRLYEDDPLAEDIADFLRQCDNDSSRAERLLSTMLGKRDQWLEVAGSVAATYRQHPERVADVLSDGVRALNASVIARFQKALGPDLQYELRTLTEHAADSLGLTLTDPTREHHFIARMLTTNRGEFRKQVTRREGFSPRNAELKARAMNLINEFRAMHLEDQVANLRHLPDPAIDPETIGRLVNVCINLTLANFELLETFDRARISDFTALILSAQSALGDLLEPTELALTLDYRVHHLLIDEFQDTSVSQFRLFEMLLRGWTAGAGSSFFAVGDPMQSIYRFRDADVGLFFQAWDEGIADLKLEPVVLTSNFRADPRLVRWTNHAFGTIMGDRQDPVLGRIGYRAATPTRAVLAVASDAPAVTLQLLPTAAAQVQAIVTRIEDLLETTDDSIALLVRSRGQLTELIDALRRQGIRWHANDIDPLLNKPAVGDLLTLVNALTRPGDRLIWFSLLRSPLVGLTLVDLQTLATVEDFPLFLRQLAHKSHDLRLSDSAHSRLQRLAAAWIDLSPKLDELPPRSVVETLWLRLGGSDAYPDPGAIGHATRLLELMDSLGPDAMNGSSLNQAAAGLFATDLSDSRLEIMTIHKSKGLEFDHVLLPFLERTTQSDEADLLLWRALPPHGKDAPPGLLMGVRGEQGPFEWLARENRLRERHERQRLFYVACTRAKLSLSLFATPAGKPPDSSMLGQLWPLLEADVPVEMRVEQVDSAASGQPTPVQNDLFQESLPVAPDPPELLRLKDGYQWQPRTIRPLNWSSTPESVRDRDPLDRRWEVVLGIVVHAALERLAGGPLPENTAAYLAEQQPLWKAKATAHDLDPRAVADVIEQTQVQLHNVLADPTGRWLLASHADGHAELAITGIIDEQIESLVIDRTFVADGRRWVVDYKTSIPPAEVDLQSFIRAEVQRYRGQLTRYATVAGALFQQTPALALYFTAIPHFERLQ